DVVYVPRLCTEVENTVQIKGNVRRPGRYQWKPGLTVAGLIGLAEGLRPGSFTRRAEIVRTLQQGKPFTFNPPFTANAPREVIAVDLSATSRMLAMGARPDADGQGVLADQVGPWGGGAAGPEGAGARTALEPMDVVTIMTETEVQPPSTVTVVGEVARPGQFELLAGMRISDLIYRAGGVKVAAQLGKAEISRRLPDGRLSIIDVDLKRTLDGDAMANFRLENLDCLSVYTDPLRRDRIRVTATGQFRRPGSYEMQRGQRLSDLVTRAGGFLPTAFLPGSVFSRETVRRRQMEERDRFIREQRKQLLDVRLQARTPMPVGTPLPAGHDLATSAVALDQAEKLLEALQLAEIKGRVSIHLDPYDRFVTSNENFSLEDGDALDVPFAPAEIVVAGEVKSPGAFVYEKGRNVGDYIRLAGGLNSRAFRREIFLIRPDGTAVSSTTYMYDDWDGIHINKPRARDFMRVAVMPGDQIVVPFDLRVKIDRTARNVDIISKAITSFGIVLNAVRR
ncbi:MAG: SLBB domain-containing protein, partial [Candidatus Riflebacteria bacterium]|nr:SLBB domain-containing protein [Candidatus Riflebacteria bacterium]